jgi:hypothetical protein
VGPTPARGVAARRRPRGIVGAAIAVAIALLASAASSQPAPSSPATERPDALRLERGSIARDQVVAIGRDLVVEGEAFSDVVAVDGTITIPGRVGGDVIVLGGDARLLAGARVDGDVFVLGGDVTSAAGATIAGRTVAYPSVSRAWLTLLEGPSLGLSSASPLVVGAKLALLCGWLVLLLLLFATAGREVLATSESVVADPFRNFLVGLTAVLSLVLSALFLTSLAASVLGVPLLFLAVFVGLLLKLWGMVAVFHALGEWVSRRLLRGRLLPLSAATVGLLLLGAAKLLPWIGVWTWTVATLIGVGAALSTKLGRREPWLAAA